MHIHAQYIRYMTHKHTYFHTNSSELTYKAHVFAIDVQNGQPIRRIVLVNAKGEQKNLRFKSIGNNRWLAFP